MSLRLAHVVLQTNRIPEMREWYGQVLDAEVVYGDDRFCFMSFDEEHHRVAFLNFEPLAPREPSATLLSAGKAPGLHHMAFTFSTLDELLDRYDRLKAAGITPHFCVNHGPTTSMYFKDPDGNSVELQIDNFATAAEGKAYLTSAAFERNPIGVEYDPEDLKARYRAGASVAELVAI